eukprot:353811-Chlamydomonas_euryale.AAC.2
MQARPHTCSYGGAYWEAAHSKRCGARRMDELKVCGKCQAGWRGAAGVVCGVFVWGSTVCERDGGEGKVAGEPVCGGKHDV